MLPIVIRILKINPLLFGLITILLVATPFARLHWIAQGKAKVEAEYRDTIAKMKDESRARIIALERAYDKKIQNLQDQKDSSDIIDGVIGLALDGLPDNSNIKRP